MTVYDEVEAAMFDGEFEEEMFQFMLKHVEASMRAGMGTESTRLGMSLDWGLMNDIAYNWARLYSAGWVKDTTTTERLHLRNEISKWIESGEGLPVLESRLAKIYGSPRAQWIASTEVTRAFAQGNLAAWKQRGIEGKQWRTAKDELVCPVCREIYAEQARAGIDDEYETLFGRQEAPPAHVGCRCWLIPVVRIPEGGFEAVEEGFQQQNFRGFDDVNEAGKWLHAYWEEMKAMMEQAEINALRGYTSSDFVEISNHLRRGSDVREWTIKQIEAIDNAFEKAAKVKRGGFVTYRGMSAQYLPDEVGTVFMDKSFGSTTVIDERTAGFLRARRAKGKEAALVEIRVTPDAKTVPLYDISQYTSEMEVLLNRNQKFRVLSITEKRIDFEDFAGYIPYYVVETIP